MSALEVMYVFHDARLHRGGLAIDIHNLANGLSERGHHVGVVMVKPPSSVNGTGLQFHSDVEVAQLQPFLGNDAAWRYGFALGVTKLLRRHSGAVVHVFSCLPVYLHFAAMTAARLVNRPFVWTPMVHPSRRMLWTEYGHAGRAMQAFDSVAPKAARLASAVAAATEAEAAEFRRIGCRRVEVIPPAVDALRPASDSEAGLLRAILGIGDGPLVLTVVGRDERRKGVRFGMRSFQRLRRRLPEAQLLLIGSVSPATASVPGVHHVDRLSASDLVRAFRAADVIFVPSIYEAFSRIVIEAWQQERPVVVTDRVALAEVVAHQGGRVVACNDAEAASDALYAFLTDEALSRKAGREGRAIVDQRFLAPQVVDRMEALYEEVRAG
jgi:glycosyltransferase involved in cell wall biosynthesis